SSRFWAFWPRLFARKTRCSATSRAHRRCTMSATTRRPRRFRGLSSTDSTARSSSRTCDFIDRIEWFISQEKEPVREVIVDARAIPTIDLTATEQLGDFVARLQERGIDFVVAKAHLPLRETVATIGGPLEDR